MPDRITRTPLALLWLAAVACSTLPPAVRPASLTLEVEVRYEISEGRGDPIELPMSDSYLTVLRMVTDPADLTESYRKRRRFLHPPEGPITVLIRCHYRIYAEPGSDFRRAAELFPGATAIRVLASDG